MKARIKSSGEVVKVYRTNRSALCLEGITWLYKDYNGHEYWADELEIVPDDMPLSDESLISMTELRKALDACVEAGYINVYGANKVVESIKI